MKLKGGMDMNAVKFAPDVREVAVALIGHARDVVVLPEEAEKGWRFNSDTGVLWRLESMFSEDDFIHDPIATINAALTDAASSDWWYSHEKDYGTDDECCYGNCGDDYESESDAC